MTRDLDPDARLLFQAIHVHGRLLARLPPGDLLDDERAVHECLLEEWGALGFGLSPFSQLALRLELADGAEECPAEFFRNAAGLARRTELRSLFRFSGEIATLHERCVG